jgi:putative Holliday junction resolvase
MPDTPEPLPAATRPRTLLGFDVGLRWIGVAVGQELTASARPLTTLRCQSQQPDWPALDRLMADWQPAALVVGLPLPADGGTSAVSEAARRFGRDLHDRYRLPVALMDERLSSHEAADRLRQAIPPGRRHRPTKAAVDALAAALILESWLRQQQVPTA